MERHGASRLIAPKPSPRFVWAITPCRVHRGRDEVVAHLAAVELEIAAQAYGALSRMHLKFLARSTGSAQAASDYFIAPLNIIRPRVGRSNCLTRFACASFSATSWSASSKRVRHRET